MVSTSCCLGPQAGEPVGQPLAPPYFLGLKKMADVRSSPDGQTLAVGGGKLIPLLDLSTRQQFDRSLAIQGRSNGLLHGD